jgi:membrane-bound lytic murein transglycosylase B
VRRPLLAAAIALHAILASAQPSGYQHRAEVKQFITEMVKKHRFARGRLIRVFRQAQFQPAIVRAMDQPPESALASWQAYRAIFINAQRIEAGVQFWERNADALKRAAAEYGVQEEIIIGIIGVETTYGRNVGTYRVIDALSTLAFDYPKRSAYFRGELENYLLFSRDQGIDPLRVKGSYAGAIGIPQFMPGSYRRFAVDYDGDGVPNLRLSAADAIGSVANFLAKHGWRRDERIELPARVAGANAGGNDNEYRKLLEAGVEPKTPLSELKKYGVETRTELALDTPVALVELENADAPNEYRLGLRNFYVLTRYNRSVQYASAVVDLAQEIKARR